MRRWGFFNIFKIYVRKKVRSRQERVNRGGSRLKEKCIIQEVSNEIGGFEEIPMEYRQEHNTVANSCVWLSACLVIRSYDKDLASILFSKYRADSTKFEWLPLFNNKRAGSNKNLYNYFKWTSECYLTVTKVRIPQEYKTLSTTHYILNVKNEGYIVALLKDASGNSSHTVGINLHKQLIYDCEEKYVMKLSQDNLSRSCGPGMVFAKFNLVAELRQLKK